MVRCSSLFELVSKKQKTSCKAAQQEKRKPYKDEENYEVVLGASGMKIIQCKFKLIGEFLHENQEQE